ncbi:hypothetical protein chiPu_0009953 [Chiloscyllium punctatum]|uniref:Basement membrane-specific heparan sulfate proteoglycan core protein n=1 Tax=Chiloscyllium punctatum TaxID=137246 RepID=A0A401SM68_CHIPU|nr:hypothetical protein [Chiloscyllium punctatum]
MSRFTIIHASKVLDEVPIPEDSELDQSHLRRRRFPLESDDEDFVTSAEGSADFEEGSTPVTVEPEHTPLTPTEIPKEKTIYYRVLVNFTTSIEYSPQLEDFDSETFREVSEGIIDTLESEFYRIPGDQSVTVVWIKQQDQNVIVELDVGSDGNSNDEEIQEVVYSVVRSGSIGPYETSVEGFKFRHLGEDVVPAVRQCHPNEFSCGSGECVPLEYRCDFRADCKDMSDEDDCAKTITTVPPPPTLKVDRRVQPTTPAAFVTPKAERRTPRPLVTAAPPAPTPDFLRPCPVDKAVCQNGQCIPRDYLCDGERDCTDGSDELDCGAPSPCEPNEFKCKNGRCALKLWRCDGDNDCMDNSDEEYCPTKGPGDMCAPEQFVCVSTRQCIPASYQCDEEADCPDRSDEFGCTPPQVITPPEETVLVKRGGTVTLTCVAAGVPTPIITWRLNWGHIPLSGRVTMTSQNGQGTLIIRDVKESDQGAYTCEAINAKGMIFAIPDALLILKSNPGVCSEGHFNVEGSLRCVPCFCFGVTRNCESTNRYRNQIHLRFTEEHNFMGVNVTAPAQPVTPPVSTSQMIVDPDSGEFQLVDLSRRFLSHDSFWTLPRQFLGNKVDSYGGSLRYKVRYSVARGQSEPEEKADVIITGNGRKLIYRTRTSTQPDVINQKEILFTETAGDYSVQHQLVFIKYLICPLSYKGLSCESCAPGFKHVLTGPYLGVCDGCNCNGHASSCDKVTGYCLSCQHNTEGRHCDKCKSGFFGDPTQGTANDCMPCPCPFTDSQRRFSETCFLDTDRRPTCDACRVGYIGRRCETCAAGYEGNPMSPGGKCTPHAGYISNCDSRGTESAESYAGSCVCKANVVGRLCNQCAPGSFNLDDANLDGCLKCFCMGISKECASSSWHRDQVRALSGEQERNLYMLTNMAHTQRITEGIKISALSELTFANFDAVPRDVYYWVLPDRFKGDKVTSYGGELRYTILHSVSPDSLPITGMPDVILQGNNIFLEHYTARKPQAGIPSTFSVPFKETAWRRADGQPATREHLLMALANIDVVMIRASYTEGMTESRISQIHMDVAVPHPTGQEQAVEVEECICPEGYKGSSCQECAFGYTRTTSGLYLGMCERCDCNGHSECDADTGQCLNCLHNTRGLRCEQCESGFYGDARGGTPNDCKPCSCPGSTPSNQFSLTCFLDSDGQATCDHCPSGYEGRNCERNLTEFCKVENQTVKLESQELIPVECEKNGSRDGVRNLTGNMTEPGPSRKDIPSSDNASSTDAVTMPTGVTKILPAKTTTKRRIYNLRHLMKTSLISFNRRLTMLEDTGLDLKDGFKHLQKRQDNLSLQLKNLTRMLSAPPKDKLISDLQWKYTDVDDKLTALQVRMEILIDGFAALAEEISELKKRRTLLTNNDQPDLTVVTTNSPAKPLTKHVKTKLKVKPKSDGNNNKTSRFVSKRPSGKKPSLPTPSTSRFHRKAAATVVPLTTVQTRIRSTAAPVKSTSKVHVKKKVRVSINNNNGHKNSAVFGKGQAVVKQIRTTAISAVTMKPAVTLELISSTTLYSNMTVVTIEPKALTTKPIPIAVLEKPTKSRLPALRTKVKPGYVNTVNNATIPDRVKGKINSGSKRVTKSKSKAKPGKNVTGHSEHKLKPATKASKHTHVKAKHGRTATTKLLSTTVKPSVTATPNRVRPQKHKIKSPLSAGSTNASIHWREKTLFKPVAATWSAVTAQPKPVGKVRAMPKLVSARKISEKTETRLTLSTPFPATASAQKRSESRAMGGSQTQKCDEGDPPKKKLAEGRKRKTKKATALDILQVLRGERRHSSNSHRKNKDLPLYITLGRLAIPIKIIPD